MRKYRKAELVLACVRRWKQVDGLSAAVIEKELADAYPDLTNADLQIIAQYGLPVVDGGFQHSRGDGFAGAFFRRVYGVAQPKVAH